MIATKHTQSIVEQTTILGWRFEIYSHQSGAWMPVTRLDPELSETQLRQQYGALRDLTEIITLEEDIVGEEVIQDHVRTLGWHFEVYSPQTETWHSVTKLDLKLTESQLRAQTETIRNPRPIGLLSEITAATYAPRREATSSGEKTTDSPAKHPDRSRR